MIAHIGETSPDSEKAADEVVRVRVGQAGGIMKALEKFGHKSVVFVGGIEKTGLLSGARPDLLAVRLFRASRDMKDDSLLRAFARHIESRGYIVAPCTMYCPELLTPTGVLGRRAPAGGQREDALYAMRLLSALKDFSTGQTAVVKDGNVLAVEAAEGTDGAIRRVGAMKVKGAVLAKAAKPGQDMRFDVPAVGPETMRLCAPSGISAVFLETGRTMLLDRDATIAAADRAGVALVGI
jgi:DUF1009 family protein